MCGRLTYLLTWEQIVRLYRLTLDQPPQNTRARYAPAPCVIRANAISRDSCTLYVLRCTEVSQPIDVMGQTLRSQSSPTAQFVRC
jgi:hypothetical protein